VQVREQHAVDAAKRTDADAGNDPDKRPDSVADHGIGEQSDAVDLEQHGGVPQPGDRHGR
jgi:hypothetical protein